MKNNYQIFLFKLYSVGLVFLAISPGATQVGRLYGFFAPTMYPLFAMTPRNKVFYYLLTVQIVYCIIINTFRTEWTKFFPYYFM